MLSRKGGVFFCWRSALSCQIPGSTQQASGSHLSERCETEFGHPWDGMTKKVPRSKEARGQILGAMSELFYP